MGPTFCTLIYQLILFTCLVISQQSQVQSITIQVSNIRNLDGHLQVAIFKNAQQFDDEDPEEVLYFDKVDITSGSKELDLKLGNGTYAITVVDDEDDSQDMTYRFGIYPKEGVGFSNYQLKGMKKPDFEDFDFLVSGKSQQIAVVIKYF